MKKNCMILSVLLLAAVLLSACTSRAMSEQGAKGEKTTVWEKSPRQEIVLQAPVIRSIQLSRSKLILQEGEQELLCLAVLPVDASREGLVWSVEDDAIACVEEGLVTALRQGMTAVHVKSADGRFDLRCAVTVVAKEGQQTVQKEDLLNGQRAISMERPMLFAACEDVFPLSVAYEALQGKEVLSYESENDNVIQVDSFGLVYALYPGSSLVYVHTTEGVIELLFEVRQEQIMLTEAVPEQKSVRVGTCFSVTEGQPFEQLQGLTVCSSDGAVAAVEGTDIVTLAKGNAQIWVYQGDMLVYELLLTVSE